MEQFVRFWRFAVRLSLGLIFLVLGMGIIIDAGPLIRSLPAIINAQQDLFPTLISSLVVLFALALLGAIGLLLLETLVNIVTSVTDIIFRKVGIRLFGYSTFLSDLLCPIPILAKSYYQNNKRTFLQYFKLKSRANSDSVSLDQVEQPLLDLQAIEIDQHLSELNESRFIDYAFAHSTITQEFVRLEHMKNDISDMYFLIIIALLVVISILKYNPYTLFEILAVIFLVLFTALLLDPIAKKRHRLAASIMVGYLDIFTLGPGADIADRDAI